MANNGLPVTSENVHLKLKKRHWPLSNIWRTSTERRTLSVRQKVSLEILVLFWNSSHLSTLLNLSSRVSDKQWVTMVMHDFINYSWEGLVVKRHSPGGLECDSHMPIGFVLLKMKQKGICQNRTYVHIWGMDWWDNKKPHKQYKLYYEQWHHIQYV